MKSLVFFSGACFGSCAGLLVGYLLLADELRERTQLVEAARGQAHQHEAGRAEPAPRDNKMPADAQKMVDDAKRRVQEHPQDPAGWRQLGKLYAMARKWAQASGFLQKAHELDPQNVELLVELAGARYGEGDMARAIEALRKASAGDPKHGLTLARLLHENGRDPEALAELARLEKLGSGDETKGRIRSLRAMIESQKKQKK